MSFNFDLLESWQLGDLQTNCYLLTDPTSEQCWVIDPGDDGDFISEHIVSNNLALQAILITHGHSDHVGGLLPLMLNFQPQIIMAQPDLFLLKNAQKYRAGDPIPMPNTLIDPSNPPVSEHFEVIALPGHTPGSVGYYFKEHQAVFTGDTIFVHGLEKNNRSYENLDQQKKSIKKLKKLPAGTMIFPGHGQPFRVDDLQRILDSNPDEA